MKNFEFYNPVKIIFGKDQIPKIAQELNAYNNIMLVYGQGSIKRNGVYDKIMSVLNTKNVVEFGGVEPNPVYETLMQAVEVAKKEKVDFILAAGGGSVIDGSKFIAAAVKYKGEDPWEMLSKYAKVEDALPLGSVLTLPATGSEMNGGSVITRKSCSEKLAFGSPLLYPKFSVLEPETMYSLPDIQIANGIVDAFVHITEQYLTYPMSGDVQDEWAASLLRVLIKNGPAVLHNRNNYDANANLMWAATMALNGLIAKGVAEDWSTHMIGHEITALYNIDHAQTLAIVLPGVLQNRKKEKSDKILHFAKSVWGINSGNDDVDIDDAIARTESFFNSVGVKTRLSDYNIPETAINIICKKLEDKKYVKLGENKNITPAVVKDILSSRL